MKTAKTNAVRTALYVKPANKLYMGVWLCATSLIDIALWDLKGKLFKHAI